MHVVRELPETRPEHSRVAGVDLVGVLLFFCVSSRAREGLGSFVHLFLGLKPSFASREVEVLLHHNLRSTEVVRIVPKTVLHKLAGIVNVLDRDAGGSDVSHSTTDGVLCAMLASLRLGRIGE